MTLETGTVLDEIYRVVKLLGKGSMGNVYLVERIEDNKKFVVKELNFSQESGLDSSSAKEIFRREAEFMENFDHPGLPKTYGVFSQNGKEYLTMDYIEGKTLEEIINTSKKPVEKNKAITWTIQIAEIIDYLHNSFQKPLVYRDLKPSNIIINPEGKPVLVDFGIARYYNPDKTSDTFNYGTPGYAAPEQYKGKGQSTPQSDIFGLGVILFQMLTKYNPSLKPLQFPSIKNLNPLIDETLEGIVLKAIQLDPLKRYISMAEFKEVLRKYHKEIPSKSGKEEITEKGPGTYKNLTGIISAIAETGEKFIKVPVIAMALSGFSILFFTLIYLNMNQNKIFTAILAVTVITFILSTITIFITSSFIYMAKITTRGKGKASLSGNSLSGSKWGNPCSILKNITIVLICIYILSVYKMVTTLSYPVRAKLETVWLITSLLILLCVLSWLILPYKRTGDMSESRGIFSIFSGGFTEHIIAVAIIFVIIFFFRVIPDILKIGATGHLVRCECNLKDLATALEMYATDNNGLYPEGFYKLLEESGKKKPYMSKIPDCTKNNKGYDKNSFTSYEYIVSKYFKNFTMWCKSDHLDCGIEQGYPQYSPSQGLIIK